MSLANVRAFERLLASGASEAQIDEFLTALENPDKGSHEERLLKHFSKKGVLRDQVAFLTALHSKGGVVDRREGSRTAFVFFSGVIDFIGVAGVRSRLSRMKANGIYLYDDRDMNYLLGVRQYGDLRQTTAVLLKLAQKLGAERLITIGSSAGGFAAIKYALALNGHASVTFSPFTTFADEHYKKDGRGQSIVDRFKRQAPDHLIDLVPLLVKRDPALELVSFYAKDMPLDEWHAKRTLAASPQVVRHRAQ
jgi:hypothetical protein